VSLFFCSFEVPETEPKATLVTGSSSHRHTHKRSAPGLSRRPCATELRPQGYKDIGALSVGINPRGDIVGFYCPVTAACPPKPNEPTNAQGFLLREGEFAPYVRQLKRGQKPITTVGWT
jgi:hypothetical protein